jgi:type II secretory pathway pseudopilin PulG
MGVAALIGMALSAAGVLLVWRTSRATREANEIARDTAYRQLRAYLSAGEATLEVWWQNGTIWASLEATVVNNGLTPATLKDRSHWVQIINGAGGGGDADGMTEIVAPRASHTFTSKTGMGGSAGQQVSFSIGCLFTYTDYLGNEWNELISWRTDIVEATLGQRHPSSF